MANEDNEIEDLNLFVASLEISLKTKLRKSSAKLLFEILNTFQEHGYQLHDVLMALADCSIALKNESVVPFEKTILNSFNSILRVAAQEIDFRPKPEGGDKASIAAAMRRAIEDERQKILYQHLMAVVQIFHASHQNLCEIAAIFAEYAKLKIIDLPEDERRGMTIAHKLLTILSEEDL